jgi:DNA recombination protein RmuC
VNWLSIIISFLIGFLAGILVLWVIGKNRSKSARNIAREILQENEARQQESLNTIIENLKASFGSLSLEALSKSTQEFLKLAKEKLESEREINLKELDTKKCLIDQQLLKINAQIEGLGNVARELEKDRVEKFGQLAGQLKIAGEQTAALMQTTNSIREALSSSRARGQWGERMAEDVLRIAGFIENVNYTKQTAVNNTRSRPDFTFLLPHNLRLNMDVKFPLDNYVRFLDSKTESEKAKFRNDFLRDVRARMKEVTDRGYINPEQNTLDYVLLFIPNEQVYSFIHEQDSSLLDEGIRRKVVFCSPITLFAVLAVIREAIDNFALEQTSNEILSILTAFKKQWNEYTVKQELLGKRIRDALSEYENLVTTRRRQLEKPLNRLEELKILKDSSEAPEEVAESGPPCAEISSKNQNDE